MCLITGSAFGQEQKVVESAPANAEEVKNIKKEIRKEVRMEDNDGVKVLTIVTDDNGMITEEVFEGEAADAKLAELMPQMEDVTIEQERVEERVEVEVDDNGNLKSVKVKTSRNGEETIEILEGVAAQKKLEEINAHVRNEIEGEKKVVKKKVKRVNAKEIEGVDN